MDLLSPEMLPLTLGGVGLVLVLIIGAVVFSRRGKSNDPMGGRLKQFGGRDAEAATADQPQRAQQAIQQIDEVVAKSERGRSISVRLAQADLKLRVAEFIGFKVVAAIIGIVAGAFVGRASPQAMFLAGLVGAVIFSFVPDFYINSRGKKRIRMFNDQLGDTITMMANALRGGFSFLMTLEMVAKEAPQPISAEFRRVVIEVGLGVKTEDALSNLQKRIPSEDLELLITAVNIQMEVGGNLAQILDTIGHTIRERVRIKGEISTLTAQGRVSGYVITALPIGLAIFISVVNPDYMAPLFKFGMPPEAWCCMPLTGLTMIVIGFFAIMKIVDVEV